MSKNIKFFRLIMFLDIGLRVILIYLSDMEKESLPYMLSQSAVYNLWCYEPESLLFIDLRPENHFALDHIPGSISVKPEGLETFMQGEFSGKLLVVVCSQEEKSVELLENKRIKNTVVLKGGFDGWSDQGFPTLKNPQILLSEKRTDLVSSMKGDGVKTDLIFHQLFEHSSSTYTYLLADVHSKEAVIIDPVVETIERDVNLVHELGLKLKYIIDTHVHADHITSAGELRKRLGAKTAISKGAQVDCTDIALEEGQLLNFGSFTIKCFETPGHTDSCMSFYVAGRLFTGDSLLIRGTGRTDFQGGSSEKLYKSISEKLFSLPEETLVFPGHDYRGYSSSTLGEEKKYNVRVGGGRTLSEFQIIMSELKLAHPKKIQEALPANRHCGQVPSQRLNLHPQLVDGIPEVTCEDVQRVLGRVRLIDVRRPEEFNNEYGHIPGAELVTLGPELMDFLQRGDREEEVAFVCRSGARSGQATVLSQDLGYKHTMNMVGGMIRWNNLSFNVEREEK